MIKIAFYLLFSISLVFANELSDVKLQLQWKHQFEFAGFYAAKEQGYYEELGLNVSFLEYESKSSIVQKVLNEEAEFGLTYASLISEYLNAKPLVFLANYFKQSPLVLVAQENIKNPSQLRGKKVMGVSDDIDAITLKLMLEKFNVSLDELKNVKTSFKLDDFIEKRVDAVAVFTTNEVYELDKKGIKYNIFNPSIYGHEYYDLNLFTSQAFLLKNPELVENFKNASNRGWEYALQNKEEVVELILQKYNTQNKTKEALLFEAKQIEQLMLSKIDQIGSINFQRVELMAKNLIESGLVEKKGLETLSELILKTSLIQNTKDLDQTANSAKRVKRDEHSVVLSAKERAYLENKKSIKICVDPDWEPYEYIDENGKHLGLGGAFTRLIEKKIAHKIDLVPTKTWAESLAFVQEKKCDVISLLNDLPQRREYLNFTPALYEEPEVIVAKNSVTYFDGYEDLQGKKVGVVEAYRADKYMQENYKSIQIIYQENYTQAVLEVSRGAIDATINGLLGSAYILRKSSFLDVKIAGKTSFVNSYKMGVNKDDEVLLSILTKAVMSITPQERQNIVSSEVVVRYEQGFDYDLLWQLMGVFFIIFLVVVYRDYTIKSINKELESKMKKQLKEIVEKDRMIFQQSKLIAMGEMIENIAHQWRQPLAQINASVMSIDTIVYENSMQTQEIEKELEYIEAITKYMSATIDDFRDFFSQGTKVEVFDVARAIENSLAVTKKSLEYYGVELKTNLESQCYIQGGMGETSQALLILINNAKDALVSRNIIDPCICINLYKHNKTVYLEVEDNAGGIDEKILERIFEPYFTTKTKTKGTGLGLYIAKMICEKNMQGMVKFKNKNFGACFKLIFKEETYE